MATKKFTDLNNYPSGSVDATTDILAIVDIASDESKKITVQDLGGALTASFAISASYALNAVGGGGTNISEVYFVTPSGDDGTAEAGNLHKPYQTIEGARAAAVAAGDTSGSLINVLPGEYTEGTLTTNYIGSFYFHPGSIISGSSGVKMFDVDSDPLNVYGYGDFYSIGPFIEMSTSGIGYFECLKVTQDSNNTFCFQNGTTELTFKANEVVFNSVMSAAGFTPRGTSLLTVDINELDSTNGNFDFHFQQGGSTSNVDIKKWTKRNGYCWLVGSTFTGGKTFLNVDQWFITGSTTWVMAYQGTGDNYHKFNGNIYVQVPIDSVLEDISGGGNHEIIMEGSAYVKSTPGGVPFDLNGGSNAEVTLDMWIESSGSTNVIDHSSGDLYLNKSLYNETGNGINTTGGNLYIDNYKAIVSGSSSSVLSTGARNVTIYNTFSSNVSASSDITFIGPGTYMSDQTGQVINNDISISGSIQLTGSNEITIDPNATNSIKIVNADGVGSEFLRFEKSNGLDMAIVGSAGAETYLKLFDNGGNSIYLSSKPNIHSYHLPNLAIGSVTTDGNNTLSVTGNIKATTEITSSTLDVANNTYIGGDLQVSGSITGSSLNLYGVDYKPWMLLGSAWFNAGVNISGDKIGPDWKNNTTAAPWPQSAYPFQIYWNPDLVDISGQGKVEMSVRVFSDQDNANGFNFGLFDGTDGFLSASLSSPWTQRTDTTLGWATATISGSDFAGKAFTNPSTDRILEFQAYSGDASNFYGIYAVQIYARKL